MGFVMTIYGILRLNEHRSRLFPLTILVYDAYRVVNDVHKEEKHGILLISFSAPVNPFCVFSWIFARKADIKDGVK